MAQEASAVLAHEESDSSKTKASSMGWALKATQKRPRQEEKVKAYLIEKFEASERSGTKADPDDKGELVFQPDEWQTAKTIKSFFSKYSAKLKQQGVSKPKDRPLHFYILPDFFMSFQVCLKFRASLCFKSWPKYTQRILIFMQILCFGKSASCKVLFPRESISVLS